MTEEQKLECMRDYLDLVALLKCPRSLYQS